jgi:hypothetical protein
METFLEPAYKELPIEILDILHMICDEDFVSTFYPKMKVNTGL